MVYIDQGMLDLAERQLHRAKYAHTHMHTDMHTQTCTHTNTNTRKPPALGFGLGTHLPLI